MPTKKIIDLYEKCYVYTINTFFQVSDFLEGGFSPKAEFRLAPNEIVTFCRMEQVFWLRNFLWSHTVYGISDDDRCDQSSFIRLSIVLIMPFLRNCSIYLNNIFKYMLVIVN